MVLPDLNKCFYLSTDASTQAISFLLCQKDDTGRTHLVAAAGRCLKPCETRYPPQRLECLALVAGVQHFYHYLAHKEFTVYSDHLSLQFLNSMTMAPGRMGCWSLYLQNFCMKIEYKKGIHNTDADAVSRQNFPPPKI